MRIYLEFSEGTASKFWEVSVDGTTHTVTYGKIGAAGRSKESSFDSGDEAIADAEKQASKKRKKGYADAVARELVDSTKPDKKSTANSDKDKLASKKKAPKKVKPPSARTLKSFYKAISEGNIEKVTSELDRGLDPSLVYAIEGGDSAWSCLYYAVYKRQVEVANLLLDRGADGGFRLTGGLGPLDHVRDAELCKRLVEAGATPTPSTLHRATNVDVARVLIDAGADVNAEDEQGRTAYERISKVDIRDLLLAHGSHGLKTTNGAIFAMEKSDSTIDQLDAQRGAIGVDHRRNLWVGGYSGLFCVEKNKTVQYSQVGTSASFDTIAHAHGIVYISTNWGLLAFDGGEFRLYNHSTSPLHDQHITQMAVVDDEVYCVGYESETKSKHISVFDGTNWRLLRPGKDLPEQCDTRCIMRDAAGRLLLSDNEEGGVYILENGSWTYDNFGGSGFTPTVYTMASHDGVDYFGTSKGLWRRPKDGELKQVLEGAFGHLVWVDDTLWAATNWKGIYVFEGEGEPEHYSEERCGLSFSNVQTMGAAADNTVYIQAGNNLIQGKDGEFSLVEKC